MPTSGKPNAIDNEVSRGSFHAHAKSYLGSVRPVCTSEATEGKGNPSTIEPHTIGSTRLVCKDCCQLGNLSLNTLRRFREIPANHFHFRIAEIHHNYGSMIGRDPKTGYFKKGNKLQPQIISTHLPPELREAMLSVITPAVMRDLTIYLIEICKDPDKNLALSAQNMLHNRVYGKPPQSVSHEVNHVKTIDLTGLSDAELTAMQAMLSKVAPEKPVEPAILEHKPISSHS